MSANDLRRIAQRPPSGGEIQSEALLLAGEEDDGVEPARLELRVPAHDGSARNEPEHAGSRLAGARPEGGTCHLGAHRVQHTGITDEQAPREEPDVRVGIEEVRGSLQGARLPPRVVVCEGDVRGSASAHSVVARNRAGIACQTQDGDVGKRSPHPILCPVL